jgi:hypothetical protein
LLPADNLLLASLIGALARLAACWQTAPNPHQNRHICPRVCPDFAKICLFFVQEIS